MINKLFKFSAPVSLCCVLCGSSLMIYSSRPDPKKDEAKNIKKQTDNKYEKSLVETDTDNQEEETVTSIKYQAIMTNSDYFYDKEYRTKGLTVAEKAEVDEIENLYSEYSKIIKDFDSELKILNKTSALTIYAKDNIVEFYDANNNMIKKINNFDIITEAELGQNGGEYFYRIKLNFSNEWETISGTQEFVNKWGNEITEANKKLFNKVLKYKLKNKTKLNQKMIVRYAESKKYIIERNNISDSKKFFEILRQMWTDSKGKYDDKLEQLFQKTLTHYSIWKTSIGYGYQQYGYFLKYLYRFWLQENQDNKILKDEYLNTEFAKIEKLTINKFKDLDVISNQIDTTISEWVINYLSNPDKEKEWKTDKFKNAKDENELENITNKP